jgi:uncharacterized protein (DUF305 family)
MTARWSGALLLPLVIVLGCTAPGPRPANTPAPDTQATITAAQKPPVSTLAPAAQFDRQLIDMLVPYYEASIEMARVAQARSQRPEVQALADEIISTSERDIAELRELRQTWFGSSQAPPMASMPVLMEPGAPVASGTILTVDLQSEVDALKQAPEPFERAFIDTMLVHQQRGNEAALLALRRVRQQELLDIAGSVIASSARVTRLLTDWRTDASP